MAQKRNTSGRKGGSASSAQGSKKGFYLLIALAAIAGVATLSYLSVQASKPKIIALDPNLPPVTSEGYVIGSPTAPIELIEFGDFECPGCGRFAEFDEPEIRAEYVNKGKIRFRYIDLPLDIHPNTLNASNAAACADEQGKFWEMHDLIFTAQHEWNAQATNNPDKVLKALGRKITGLDGGKFDECIDSRRMMPKVQSHLKIAVDRGVRGTPNFQIGSKQFPGMNITAFKQVLDSEIAAAEAAAKGAATGATKKP